LGGTGSVTLTSHQHQTSLTNYTGLYGIKNTALLLEALGDIIQTMSS